MILSDGVQVSLEETSEMVFSGSVNKEGKVYIARVFWSKSSRVSHFFLLSALSSERKRRKVLRTSSQLRQLNRKDTSFPLISLRMDPSLMYVLVTMLLQKSQFLKQVALSVLSDYQLVITTNTGAVQLWSIPSTEHPSPDLIWNREEALSAITVSEFVELPEQTSVVSVKLQNEGFTGRLLRQLVEAQVTTSLTCSIQFT